MTKKHTIESNEKEHPEGTDVTQKTMAEQSELTDKSTEKHEELSKEKNEQRDFSIQNPIPSLEDETLREQINIINKSTEPIAKQLDNLTKSMQPYAKAIEQFSKQYEGFFYQVGKTVVAISNSLEKIHVKSANMIDTSAIAHSFEFLQEIAIKMAEGVMEEKKDREEYGKSRLHQWSQFGWVPTERLMTIFQSRLFVPETQEEADEQIIKLVEGQTDILFEELQKTFADEDFIYRNALGCYEHELYYAAGLSIFSGIEREMQSYKHPGLNTGSAFLKNFVKKMTLDEENAYFQLTEGLTHIFDDLYASFDRPPKNGIKIAAPDALNRNRMDHGASRDLDKVDVVKLFFFWTCFANFLKQVLKDDSE